MKDKNLPDDIKNKSLLELIELVNNLIENLENNKDLEKSSDDYQKLLLINSFIQKKFQQASKNISFSSKGKIDKILKK